MDSPIPPFYRPVTNGINFKLLSGLPQHGPNLLLELQALSETQLQPNWFIHCHLKLPCSFLLTLVCLQKSFLPLWMYYSNFHPKLPKPYVAFKNTQLKSHVYKVFQITVIIPTSKFIHLVNNKHAINIYGALAICHKH